MEKIKFIIDSSSDLTHEDSKRLNIEIVPMGINVEGEPYHEGVDFTNEEFYVLMDKVKELPSTSAINPATWYGVFEKYAKEDEYNRLVVSTVGSALSNTYEAALTAAKEIKEAYPNRNLEISVFDSGSASAGYGYPMSVAAKMHEEGKGFEEIKEFFDDWYNSFEVYFVAFSFDVVRRSGRVNAPTAYIGEKLNLRPIMQNVDGVFSSYAKVRGDNNVPLKLLSIAKERMREGSPYLLLNGTQPMVCDKIVDLFNKELGIKPSAIYQPGPAMVVNAGPKMLCIGFLGERRR